MWYLRLTLCGLLSVYTMAQRITDIELRYASVPTVPTKLGIVYIEYAGIKRAVCSELFNNDVATVVCRQLGFDGHGLAVEETDSVDFSSVPSGQRNFWVTQLTCSGEEERLDDCLHLGFGVDLGNCLPNDELDYAKVVCLGDLVTTTTTTTTTTTVRTTTTPQKVCDTPDPNIRLVDIDGNVHAYEGRVQVRRLTTDDWGEICDERWGQDDAEVVARMLCYNTNDARAHAGGYKFGNRTADTYTMNEVQCTGSETDIFDCPFTENVADCTIQEAASVSVRAAMDPTPPLPVSNIVCDGAVETIHVSFPKSSNPGLQPSHLSLTDQSVPDDCATVGQNSSEVYISIPFVSCGTSKTYNDTYIMYRNQITHHITTTGTITRQQPFTIEVYCLMGRNGDPDNEVDPEVVTLPPQYGTGEPILEINIYETDRYRNKIQELPAQFLLGQRVHVAMELFTTDTELKVILQQCYVTPEESPDSTPQEFLIVEKCVVEPSVEMNPLSDTKFGFSFTIFTFTDLDNSQLYLHCKGIVCGLSESYGRCDRTCGTGIGGIGSERKKRSVDDGYSENYLSGLLDFRSDRFKRQADFEPVEIDVDSGPIYIMQPDISTTMTSPTVPNDITTQQGELVNPVRSTNDIMSDEVSTGREETPTTAPQARGPVLVQDYPIASTATLIQITLSLLVSIVMALILT